MKTWMGVLLLSSAMSSVWASCASSDWARIQLRVANFTGYPLSIDLSKAYPDYHDSYAGQTTLKVPADPTKNIVALDNAINIRTCLEIGPSMQGGGTLSFYFSNADTGNGPGALGDVKFSLQYSAQWDSNEDLGAELTHLNIDRNIFETIPGSTPITGVGYFAHQDPGSIAYLNLIFYDLAPAVNGNVNVLKPMALTSAL